MAFTAPDIKEQAERWATRYGKKSYINNCQYTTDESLKYLELEKMTEA